MATIDNQDIPGFVIKEFQNILDTIPSAHLLSYVKSRPELIKGFRPIPSNLSIIRKRLNSIFAESGEIDRGILAFIAGESLNIELVIVFSETALSHLFSTFVQYYGPQFIAAALLDEREGVRRLAFDSLQGESERASDQSGGDHAAVIKTELSLFLGHISSLLDEKQERHPGQAAQMAEDYGEELQKCRKKIAALEKRQEKNREESRLGKKISSKIDSKDSAIAALREKLDREKISRKELGDKLERKVTEVVELKETLEIRIKEGIDREMRAVVRGWLKKPKKREAAAFRIKTRSNSDLLARAADVLSRQEAQDRDFGNKRVLAERLRKLAEARTQLNKSGSDALNPLPELLEIKNEIDREITKIRDLLGAPEKSNPFLDNLKIKINSASASQDLSRLQNLLFDLEQIGIIGITDLKDLYGIYNRRMDLLYEKYAVSPEEVKGSSDPGWTIRKALNERQEFHLVVDGHNVLFGLADLFSDYYEDGVPSVKAREKLLQLLEGMLRDSPSRATVFFDGSVASERSFSLNVKEIYSGGGGPQVRNRADQAILDYLTVVVGGKKRGPAIVVSNDLELQKLVREKGAQVMPLMQFDALVSEFYA